MIYKLPSTCDIPVRSYLHHAYPLGILYANSNVDNADNFVEENYTQLVWEYKYDRLNFYNLFFPYWSCFERKWKQVFVTQDDLIKGVRGELLDKYYVYLICDEFYIEHRTNFRKKHYIHDILVFGFDDSKKIFFYCRLQ